MRGGLIEGYESQSTIMWAINALFIFGLSVYFIFGMQALGEWIKSKFIKLETDSIFQVVLSWGIGLIAFILVNYVAILVGLMYSLVSWILFLGLGVLIYLQRERLSICGSIISDKLSFLSVENFKQADILKKVLILVTIVLLVISILYLFYGYVLSYIPYPTAWDANHAYMFRPRVWAINNGYMW